MKQTNLAMGSKRSEAKPLDLSGAGQALRVSLDSASGSCLTRSGLNSSWGVANPCCLLREKPSQCTSREAGATLQKAEPPGERVRRCAGAGGGTGEDILESPAPQMKRRALQECCWAMACLWGTRKEKKGMSPLRDTVCWWSLQLP